MAERLLTLAHMETRGDFPVLFTPLAVAVCFISSYALFYLVTDPSQFGIYRPRYEWLYVHVLCGTLALLLCPVQFWLGVNRRNAPVHRVLGIIYVTAVGVGAITAFYLAWHTDFGWVFGIGFAMMAFAWISSTALATIAICRRRVEQHREWITRSYILTFSFVTFRIVDALLELARAGTILERKTAASWLAWTMPLFVAELIIQGRKIFAEPVNEAPPRDAHAYTAAPKPVAFSLQSSGSPYPRQP